VKRLTLLRHAKSSWAEHGLADDDRPLSNRGRHDAPRMGERLAARGLQPDLILSSPAVRARQTAALAAPAFRHAVIETRFESDIYLASPGELLRVLSHVDDTFHDILLVGHNPGLTTLANMLLPELALNNLPTAGAVSVDCATESWHEIDAARFSLRFYDFPKNPQSV
jgi:phosphohistidine phosphatase